MHVHAARLGLLLGSLVAVVVVVVGASCDGCSGRDRPDPAIPHAGTPDDLDGDGVRNGVDKDVDGDGIANTDDDDIDGDDTPNADDTTPFGEADDQSGAQGDIDGDGIPNGVDDDDDGDGVPDGIDGVGTCDGVNHAASEDSDCDGYCLEVEIGFVECDDGVPPGTGAPDSDGDGLPDISDSDDDGDGVPDADDDDPAGLDPTANEGEGAGPGEGEGEGEGPAHPGDCGSFEIGNNQCDLFANCEVAYPYSSDVDRTDVDFNESEVLAAMFVVGPTGHEQVRVYYADEHALTLGVRRVDLTDDTGTSAHNFPLTGMSDLNQADSAFDPDVGTSAEDPDPLAGTDEEERPIYPSLFVTDITDDPERCSEGHEAGCGDWQFGGTSIPPHAVFGTWKADSRTIDTTQSPPAVTTSNDSDPAKNHFNLDQGDPVADLEDEGYISEIRWDVDRLGLQPGHLYRLYVIVHDGDHSADVGQACGIAQF